MLVNKDMQTLLEESIGNGTIRFQRLLECGKVDWIVNECLKITLLDLQTVNLIVQFFHSQMMAGLRFLEFE